MSFPSITSLMRSKPGWHLRGMRILINIISSLLIILWIYTGTNKLLDYNETFVQMSRSPFIASMAGFLSYAIPIGELALVLLLVIHRTRLWGLYLSYLLMALFTGYIWLMLNFATDLPCSCGGILSSMTWQDHLAFNVVFTIMTAIGILVHRRIMPKSQ